MKAGSTSAKHPPKERGFRMIDRQAFDQPVGSSQPVMPNYLTRLQDFAFNE
jgi:hypothetical protein